MIQKKSTYKTPEEKVLAKKYLPLFQSNDFDELQQLAKDFKEDLKLFLVKTKKGISKVQQSIWISLEIGSLGHY